MCVFFPFRTCTACRREQRFCRAKCGTCSWCFQPIRACSKLSRTCQSLQTSVANAIHTLLNVVVGLHVSCRCCCLQSSDVIRWDDLLDASSAHKLMYSLQIVEYLSRPPRIRKASIVRHPYFLPAERTLLQLSSICFVFVCLCSSCLEATRDRNLLIVKCRSTTRDLLPSKSGVDASCGVAACVTSSPSSSTEVSRSQGAQARAIWPDVVRVAAAEVEVWSERGTSGGRIVWRTCCVSSRSSPSTRVRRKRLTQQVPMMRSTRLRRRVRARRCDACAVTASALRVSAWQHCS